MLIAIKRCLIVGIGVIIQLGFPIIVRLFFHEHSMIINIIYKILSILIVLKILKDSVRLSNDLPWIILILLFPIFGTIVLITIGRNVTKSKLLRNVYYTENKYNKYLKQDEKTKEEIEKEDMENLQYIINRTAYPITKNNQVTYYEFGEKFYPALLKELKKAEKFIFMEYFIIDEGVMWNSILEILKEKANSGVDVRIIYDDAGNVAMLAASYPKELAKFNIKCIPFNKLSPVRGVFMNNRDHRKMTIIDGKVAFSGGLNLRDEYININSKLGIWKDNGIKIVGDAIWNLTIMFLTMWNANLKEDDDLEKFKYDFKNEIPEDGYVVPYGVSPLHKDLIGEDIYINMITSAKKYLYIMTPYLIIDTDVVNALIRTAKRGVDVRIIVPGIPDKKIVYTQTTSFFKLLHDNGVKIYKYQVGFVHAKVFLSDDTKAIVGTINLDYRSLYLHFENGIYLEKNKEIDKIKKDFIETFEQCEKLTDNAVKTNIFKSIWQSILRLFAPLF